MGIKINVSTIKVGEEEFYTVTQFCAIVSKSNQHIYNLISKGNSVRKLKHIKIAKRVLIYASELTEFPFTLPGPECNGKQVYHYTKDGKPNWEELDYKKGEC